MNWDDMKEVLKYLPPRQASRVERIMEVNIFADMILHEYCKVHLMDLFPGQPDMYWDFCGWCTPTEVKDLRYSKNLLSKGSIWITLDPFVSNGS